MHVLHLGPGTAYRAALRGGQHWRNWNELESQGLNQINSLKFLAYVMLMANRDPKKKPPDPPQWYPDPAERLRMFEKKQIEKSQPKVGSFAFMVKRAKEAKRVKVG